ncbi:MAG: amidophosphoribosyltransferase [Elainellaceae cyanobacterium]
MARFLPGDGANGQPEKPDPDKPKEACGIFGVYAPEEAVAKLTYFGLFALQHRGQEAAGIATFEGDKVHLHKNAGLVNQVFNEDVLGRLPGNLAVGHTRYSTTGGSHTANAQPVLVETERGPFALAHNGNLVNAHELRQELSAGADLQTTADSEMIALAVAEAIAKGLDWIDATAAALKRCRGAFSLTMGTPAGIMGARDPNGIRPLVIGQLAEGGPYVLASEPCALDIIGAKHVRNVEPGELVWIDGSGLRSVQWSAPERKLCVFEMIYFSRPDSIVDGETLYSYRLRLGRRLAQESPADVDLVIGVPDSGIPAAIGYSEALGVPYAEGLIKNRYVGRTFIQPTQAMRESGIRMKLNPLRDVLTGKRIAIIDDSVVRGTTSRKIVKALRDAGATEVHMRISSPPVTHPCFYGIDTDNQEQLIAAKQSVADIERHIEADSLAYLSWEGMLDESRQDRDRFCSACFTGEYPIEVPTPMKRSKLMLENLSEPATV